MKKLLPFLLISVVLSGCATTLPSPKIASYQGFDNLTGPALFTKTFLAHGGEDLDQLKNVNVGLEDQWKQLIRRIQPLVTDFTYRVKSQERLLPKERVYTSHYEGPGGTKTVFRSPEKIRVWYNSVQSNDPAVLSSTSLTGDSFHLFLLGPLALAQWHQDFQRISDVKLKGYRILGSI